MDAHAMPDHHGKEHSHPTPWVYLRVALILFVLTALEVLAFELGRRPGAPLHTLVEPVVVPILLVLSAVKFALVAMFYMHLKQDDKLFSNLFVWPLILAGVIILSLILIFSLWLKASY